MAFTPLTGPLGALAAGVSQILGRTLLLATNTGTGIPVPLAVLDVVKSEIIEYEAEVTEHPVEQGLEIGDHRQPKNPTIRLKGEISNTPLDLSVAIANIAAGTLAAISSSQARSNLLNSGFSQSTALVGAALQGGSNNAAANAFAGAVDAVSRTILEYAFELQAPFTVVTRRKTFTNCVIQRLRFPRTEETGYALEFEIDIKQLRIVSSLQFLKSAVAEDVVSTASSSTNLGSQATQTATPQVASGVKGSTLMSSPGVAGKFSG